MTLVDDLVLPEFDHNDPDLTGEVYHQRLAELRREGWLARSPLAVIVLDRAAGEFFLRSRATAFPGREIAALFGIAGGPLLDHIDANILNLRGDRHRRLRSLVSPAFTPRAADRWRPCMRGFLAEVWQGLGGLGGLGGCEFMAAVARPYPSLVIAALLGAPAEDAPRLQEWSNWVQRQFDIRALAGELPQIETAVVEVSGYVEALLDHRRMHPAEDLLGALLSAEEDGDRLTHAECVNLVVNVLAGGVDTTQSQLGHAIRLFADHPDQWELLGRDPDLVPRAVQEVLRFEPITPFTARLCVEPVTYDGVEFPAGTIVAVCAERPNREPPGGESFDITAERDGRLLTFGAGTHYCLGANLATAELEEALRYLAPRMPRLTLDGPPLYGGVEGIYGIDALPVRWG